MGVRLGKRLNQCFICKKSYSTKGALQRHVRYECGVEPQFKCHLCDRRFCHNYHLKTHLILHERRSFLQWIHERFYGLQSPLQTLHTQCAVYSTDHVIYKHSTLYHFCFCLSYMSVFVITFLWEDNLTVARTRTATTTNKRRKKFHVSCHCVLVVPNIFVAYKLT